MAAHGDCPSQGDFERAYLDAVSIFRRPHEWAYRDPVARARAVENTVLHEVAHHLGIDEENIRRIEAARKRPAAR